MKRFLLACCAAAAMTLLSGCLVAEYLAGEKPYKSLEGNPFTDIRYATGLGVQDGRLIIAVSGRSRGVAVVDTATGTILTHHVFEKREPVDLISDSSGKVYVSFNEAVLGWLDSNGRRYREANFGMPHGGLIFASGGYVFSLDNMRNHILQARLENNRLEEGGQLATPEMPFSVAAAAGTLFISFDTPPYIRAIGLTAPWNSGDTLQSAFGDIIAEHGIHRPDLVGWKNRLFAIVNHHSSTATDKSFVAVLDAQTQALIRIIPLAAESVSSGSSIRDGVLYLNVEGAYLDALGNNVLDGSVEAIDLETATYAGVITTEAALGVRILKFVSTGPGTGYVIHPSAQVRGRTVVRKIHY